MSWRAASSINRREVASNLFWTGIGVITSSRLAVAAAQHGGDPVVETRSGKIRGEYQEGVYTFKGIPYAATTTGANRFMPPQRREPWSGVRDTRQFGPMALQRIGNDATYKKVVGGYFPQQPFPASEDCLAVNVWTSELGSGNKLPVMVWLHPGGFMSGAGNSAWCIGDHLARSQNVVVVTLNHRLNIFGFLHLGELGNKKFSDSGNVGMLDVISALTWVQENIAAFGGDPDSVTIFGESGGGSKVATLLAMPLAKGLFHRAIIQSGVGVWALGQDEATDCAFKVIDRLGITPARLDELQSISADAIAAASKDVMCWPVVGSGLALPQQPFGFSAPKISSGVPLLIGTTKDEGTYYTINDRFREIQDETDLRRALINAHFWDGVDTARANRSISAYRNLHPDQSMTEMFVGITTNYIREHAYMIAERKTVQNRAPVYMYLFTWEPPAFKSYKSGHCMEIPFVFDRVDAASSLFGATPNPNALAMARKISTSWANFARLGDPSVAGQPKWQAYDLGERFTMELNYEWRPLSDPYSGDRQAFEELRHSRSPTVWGFPHQ